MSSAQRRGQIPSLHFLLLVLALSNYIDKTLPASGAATMRLWLPCLFLRHVAIENAGAWLLDAQVFYYFFFWKWEKIGGLYPQPEPPVDVGEYSEANSKEGIIAHDGVRRQW